MEIRRSAAPYCPLSGESEARYQRQCLENKCAWWDLMENQCCVVTMAKWLAALPSYIEALERGG